MSGDRFDLELRNVLREEAAQAPVVLTLGQLRTRAGTRPRWSGRIGTGHLALGTAIAAIVALALIVSLSPARLPSTAGTSPSVPPLATAPAVVPVPSTPSSPVALGSSGSAVVVRVAGDRLDVLEWNVDGSWRSIATVPSLSSLLGDWAFDGYHEIAISDGGRLAIPVARGPAGAQETRLALLDLGRPTAPAIVLQGMGAPAFLSDETLVGLGLGPDNTVLRAAPPYTGAPVATVLPPDIQAGGPAGNVTTPLSLLPDEAGLFGFRSHPDASGSGESVDELVAIRWDGSVRAADPTTDPLLVTGADRLVDRLGRTAFVQDPHQAVTPAFVAQAPGQSPVAIGSAAVSTDAWRPGGQELAFVEDGILKVWDGGSTVRTIDPIPTPSDGSFITGFSTHAVYIEYDGRTWGVPFGECLRCSGPSGHLDGHVVRVLP